MAEEKNDKDMLYAFSRIYHRILDAKIPKFTNAKFEKKTDIKLRNGGPQRV